MNPSAASALAAFPVHNGSNLLEMSQVQPLLLVFLRHEGCIFCREALDDLSRTKEQFPALGTQLVLIHQGDPGQFQNFTASYGLQETPSIADPECRLYQLLGVPKGSWNQLMGWRVWLRGLRALWRGHRVGTFKGTVRQMPGLVLFHQGRVIANHPYQSAADRPDYIDFVRRNVRQV